MVSKVANTSFLSQNVDVLGLPDDILIRVFKLVITKPQESSLVTPVCKKFRVIALHDQIWQVFLNRMCEKKIDGFSSKESYHIFKAANRAESLISEIRSPIKRGKAQKSLIKIYLQLNETKKAEDLAERMEYLYPKVLVQSYFEIDRKSLCRKIGTNKRAFAFISDINKWFDKKLAQIERTEEHSDDRHIAATNLIECLVFFKQLIKAEYVYTKYVSQWFRHERKVERILVKVYIESNEINKAKDFIKEMWGSYERAKAELQFIKSILRKAYLSGRLVDCYLPNPHIMQKV